ncbi:MAG: DUF4252 domain-containing protein [Ferruginibacter sp.]|nr:DUF4252 domain-containing protein [Cytophagales bacterium]
MKILFLLACLCAAPGFTQAQSKAIDALQRKYQGTEETFTLNVNGHLLKLLMWFDGGEDDPEVKELVKDVRHVKILRVPNRKRGMSGADFHRLKADVKKEAFDELITLRSDGNRVDILIREKNDRVSDVLFLVEEADDFVVLALRGKFDLNQVFRAVNKVDVKGR